MAKKKQLKTTKTSVVATLTPQVIKDEFGVTDLANKSKSIGDSFDATFHATGDFRAGFGAIGSYRTVVSAMKALLIYKKLTGTPMEIEFFKN
jgi:hypothetical protein